MASNQEVGITLTANSASVEAAFAKINAALDKTVDRLDKMDAASKKATSSASGGLESATASAAKFAAGLAGVGTASAAVLAAAAALRREYDNLVSRQKGAADTQLNFENALAQAVRNAGVGVLSGGQVRDMALKLAGDASVDPAKAASVLSDAFSAKGVNNQADAEMTRSAAAAVLKFAPELESKDAATFAGTAIDIMKRTGLDARQAVGLTQMTSGTARTTTLKGVAENVMPGALQMMELGGGSVSENAALMSALTQGIVDPEGAVSRTAGITLAKELRERMPDVGTTAERLAKLQADPKLQKAFLEGGRFGRKQFGAAEIGRGQASSSVESLVRGQGTAFDAFQENRKALGDVGQAGQAYDQMVAAVNSVTFTSRLKRAFSGATSEQQILDQTGGQTSVNREGLREFLKASGQSKFSQDVDSILFESGTLGGSSPVEAAASRLRSKAASLRSPQAVSVAGGGGGGSFAPMPYRPANAEELRAADAFQKLADQLSSLREELKKNTDATKRNTDVAPPLGTSSRPVSSAALNRAG